MLTHERLQQLFTYDAEFGALLWNSRPRGDFATSRAHALWNTKYAGKAAGSRRKDGYVSVKIDDQKYLAHRLIWFYVHGCMPIGDVDHEYGVAMGDHACHLRDVPHAANQRNQKRPHTNRSGAVGVRRAKSGRWRAEIEVDGNKHHLGVFDTFEQALRARKNADRLFGFHLNHGRFGALDRTGTEGE